MLQTFGGYGYSSMLIHLNFSLLVLFEGKPFLTVQELHGFDYNLINALLYVNVSYWKTCICKENNGCDACVFSTLCPPCCVFVLNPLLFWCLFCPLHTLDLTFALMATPEMGNKMKHLILMAAALDDTVSFRNICKYLQNLLKEEGWFTGA